MQTDSATLLPALVGFALGLLALGVGFYLAGRSVSRARDTADELLTDAQQEAESRKKELLVEAQEKILASEEEFDRRERELHERELSLDRRAEALELGTRNLEKQKRELERRLAECADREESSRAAAASADENRERARQELERVAGLTREEAHSQLVAQVEQQARADAERVARKIDDESRETAERRAIDLMIEASQRVKLREVLESTVSFLELPSDEMKGRIIGREGRNIRALEMATGIDLIVDDTPRSILISSFDPIRREVAKLAIQRLVEDGRIHPARIEEVVQRVREEIEGTLDGNGAEAGYALGISDLHPRLVRMVGQMRYHTDHGQNLLQHCIETALISGHMAREVGEPIEMLHRAGLLHEIGQVDEESASHPVVVAADLCARFGESEAVVHAIRSLHSDVEPQTRAAMLLRTANRMSENRPGARKENLAVFIERLRRLEKIATGFSGVDQAYAVKAGKEIRVLIDAQQVNDRAAHSLCKQIARAVERELSYPGQIKVSVVRETRAVRFAL